MTKKYIAVLLAIAAVGILAVGCYSTHTTTMLWPHKIKVVDSLTKRPIAGAQVEMSGSGSSIGLATDERGVTRIGSYGLYTGPKMETMEVTMQGYESLSLRLTNGLPNQVEMTPIQSHK
jgi:hypothetical protein